MGRWSSYRYRVSGLVRCRLCRYRHNRHTTASQLILAGATLQEVKEILGHSDIKLTLRYAHLNPAQLRAAVARIRFSAPGRETGTESCRTVRRTVR
jgi:integrase